MCKQPHSIISNVPLHHPHCYDQMLSLAFQMLYMIVLWKFTNMHDRFICYQSWAAVYKGSFLKKTNIVQFARLPTDISYSTLPHVV